MRAAVLEQPAPARARPLQLRTVPRPEPRRGEVLVQVEACGVCRTDLHVIEGELAPRRRPVIPGHQIVGRVVATGAEVDPARVGTRVGVPWLHRTCSDCRFCHRGDENLCEASEFTGWTVDGGFAEYTVAPADFVLPLPDALAAIDAAPLLCAGIIGYRCLDATGLDVRGFAGARLGLYGFGAAGHLAIQIARARGAEVYVMTRDRARHQALAHELGATWVGDADATPPVPLDAAIVFAPAGTLVPVGLAALDAGGTLVLGGIHMSEIPAMPYALVYRERRLRSVANNTRADARRFLDEAARVGVRTHVRCYPLAEVGEALVDLATDAIRGAAVVVP
ncbi:MAG: zinc-dependent alcohol dehydrogenase family protein [Nannocystaceae bacterium]|nr:zinc-dependent alcohol dehydrogenase family protein [Nannocystaceae bacterium]